MLPLAHPARFEREHGCTEAEWLGWLPGAVRDQTLIQATPGRAEVLIGAGRLRLQWAVLPERRIALVRLPRLHVLYGFDGVDAPARNAFMRYFDLYMQRGGG